MKDYLCVIALLVAGLAFSLVVGGCTDVKQAQTSTGAEPPVIIVPAHPVEPEVIVEAPDE